MKPNPLIKKVRERFGKQTLAQKAGEETMVNGTAYITVLVGNQDEAIEFYQEKLGLEVRLDVPFGPKERWVTVAPKGSAGPEFSLVQADSPAKQQAVGRQAGDHVLFVLTTEDVDRDHADLKARGVEVLGDPENLPWGRHFLFRDPYGNVLDLLQPAPR
ncbi:MAG: VOC family protein [Meiothermus sp.]|nr:VOC family protein [Meiothermus sp.]